MNRRSVFRSCASSQIDLTRHSCRIFTCAGLKVNSSAALNVRSCAAGLYVRNCAELNAYSCWAE